MIKRLLLCAIVATQGMLFSQVQAGRIVGTVYDPQHAAVPGATITITEATTNLARKVTADNSGDYVMTPLQPGNYTLAATSAGFQTTVRSGIELTVGQAARVDLDLTGC
jgi:uncharacterized surface anchored protein